LLCLAAAQRARQTAGTLSLCKTAGASNRLQNPAQGALISSIYFRRRLAPASVPTTVLAALVNDGVYTNIYFGKIWQRSDRAFTNSWWFRKEIDLTREQARENADLIFEGSIICANIWLNGNRSPSPMKLSARIAFSNSMSAANLNQGKCSGRGNFSAATGRFHDGLCGLESKTRRR